jgi:YVTN family beta-propeller protein
MYKSSLGSANFSGLRTASPDILRFYNFRERRDNRRTSLDSSGSRLYTVNGASNDVSAVDLKSRKELRRFKVGDGPWGDCNCCPGRMAWARVYDKTDGWSRQSLIRLPTSVVRVSLA